MSALGETHYEQTHVDKPSRTHKDLKTALGRIEKNAELEISYANELSGAALDGKCILHPL